MTGYYNSEVQMRYNREKKRFFGLSFARSTKADVIEKLESVDSVQGYIESLIKADLEGRVQH